MNLKTLATCTALALAGGAQLATSQTPVTDPAQFAAMAASSDMFEIQSSELALEKSQTEAVRTFAQHMIEDHALASEAMMVAAETDGVAPPMELLEKHQVELERLEALEADAFDAAYIAAQTTDHQEAVALFEAFSTQAEESALRGFAGETLPTLQEHLDEVQALQES